MIIPQIKEQLKRIKQPEEKIKYINILLSWVQDAEDKVELTEIKKDAERIILESKKAKEVVDKKAAITPAEKKADVTNAPVFTPLPAAIPPTHLEIPEEVFKLPKPEIPKETIIGPVREERQEPAISTQTDYLNKIQRERQGMYNAPDFYAKVDAEVQEGVNSKWRVNEKDSSQMRFESKPMNIFEPSQDDNMKKYKNKPRGEEDVLAGR